MWLLCTGSGRISEVAGFFNCMTLPSRHVLRPDHVVNIGSGRIKQLLEVSGFLNCVTVPEGVKRIFGFTKNILRVACNDLNCLLKEGLVSKPLKFHL